MVGNLLTGTDPNLVVLLHIIKEALQRPEAARAPQQARGVAAIYGPGTPMLESVRDVLMRISQHHD